MNKFILKEGDNKEFDAQLYAALLAQCEKIRRKENSVMRKFIKNTLKNKQGKQHAQS